MAVDFEAVGRKRLYLVRAPMDIERLIAGVAEEVVVMRSVGQLVPKDPARELHLRQPSLANEGLDVPVDGRHTQRRHDSLAVPEDFVTRERAPGVHEDAADRPALTGVSLH